MKNLKKNKKGFTLIEIIVVLVIMGILIAIAVPSVLGYVNKAKDQKYLAEARGYYIGAQGIVTSKNGKDEAVTTADLYAAKVEADAGIVKTESNITASVCDVTTDVGKAKITECKYAVKGNTDRYISIKPNKEAEFVSGTVPTES